MWAQEIWAQEILPGPTGLGVPGMERQDQLWGQRETPPIPQPRGAQGLNTRFQTRCKGQEVDISELCKPLVQKQQQELPSISAAAKEGVGGGRGERRCWDTEPSPVLGQGQLQVAQQPVSVLQSAAMLTMRCSLLTPAPRVLQPRAEQRWCCPGPQPFPSALPCSEGTQISSSTSGYGTACSVNVILPGIIMANTHYQQ